MRARYRIVELGAEGSLRSYAGALNEWGHGVGCVDTPDDRRHTVQRVEGQAAFLKVPGNEHCIANGINRPTL